MTNGFYAHTRIDEIDERLKALESNFKSLVRMTDTNREDEEAARYRDIQKAYKKGFQEGQDDA